MSVCVQISFVVLLCLFLLKKWNNFNFRFLSNLEFCVFTHFYILQNQYESKSCRNMQIWLCCICLSTGNITNGSKHAIQIYCNQSKFFVFCSILCLTDMGGKPYIDFKPASYFNLLTFILTRKLIVTKKKKNHLRFLYIYYMTVLFFILPDKS